MPNLIESVGKVSRTFMTLTQKTGTDKLRVNGCIQVTTGGNSRRFMLSSNKDSSHAEAREGCRDKYCEGNHIQ